MNWERDSLQVIIFMGLPASGKSTLAEIVIDTLDDPLLLSTDSLRNEIFSHISDERGKIYSEVFKTIIYKTIIAIIKQVNSKFSTIVIDGTYHIKKRRTELINELNKLGIEPKFIFTYASDDTIQERMYKRNQENSESEADYSVFIKLKAEFEPIELQEQLLRINTEEPIRSSISKIFAFLNK